MKKIAFSMFFVGLMTFGLLTNTYASFITYEIQGQFVDFGTLSGTLEWDSVLGILGDTTITTTPGEDFSSGATTTVRLKNNATM